MRPLKMVNATGTLSTMAGGVFGAAAGLLAMFSILVADAASAKTPGTTYCFLGICHRVLTIEETRRETGLPIDMIASFYDTPERDRFNPSLVTSSGEVFRAEADDSAASPIYPDGTRVLVFEPASGGAAVLRINNAGPYFSNRLIDLSRGAAEKLGIASRGVARVELVVLSAPQEAETRYVLGRVYAPVPGFIGRYTSLQAAREAVSSGLVPLTGAGETSAVLTPLVQPPSRVVIITGRGRSAARGRRGARVVLLPVKQRRPQLLASLVRQKPVKVKLATARRR